MNLAPDDWRNVGPFALSCGFSFIICQLECQLEKWKLSMLLRVKSGSLIIAIISAIIRPHSTYYKTPAAIYWLC